MPNANRGNTLARIQFVRLGAMGTIGRCRAPGLVRYARGMPVVVRTRRGLETGEVLGPPRDEPGLEDDGEILRRMTVEDQLLAARLAKHRVRALASCQAFLDERRLPLTLVDVEPLFDGSSVVFYFLGEPGRDIDPWLAELAEAYDAHAQIRAFAEAVTQGCGPGCGTAAAGGPGCSTCAESCAAAGACGVRGR
jgi:cell fate regulator YaaT (PSP1 superfamily)